MDNAPNREKADHYRRVRNPRNSETQRDRKSTRLNSSHGYISYAVFCLKKKNTVEMQLHLVDANTKDLKIHPRPHVPNAHGDDRNSSNLATLLFLAGAHYKQ